MCGGWFDLDGVAACSGRPDSAEPGPRCHRVPNRAADRTMNCLRVGKPHFPFRGVDIDVHRFRRNVYEQHAHRESPARKQVSIGLVQGMAE